MKNIVSFSLWGDHPMYWAGALRNIELANQFYPGFVSRFYIDANCSPALIDTIAGKNTEVVLVNSKGPFHGAFWRFWPADEEDVDIVLSRDCDSRISERETLAVWEWLNSDKDFHIMRDHPHHWNPVLGGMWGCRNGILRNINLTQRINDWSDYSYKCCEQDFMAQTIYPYVKAKTMEHSEFDIRYWNEIRCFPHRRENYEYVGDVFDENEQRHQEYLAAIQNVLR